LFQQGGNPARMRRVPHKGQEVVRQLLKHRSDWSASGSITNSDMIRMRTNKH